MAVAGAPYDTLEEVIGIRDSHGLGSLKDYGVKYREVPVSYFGANSINLVFFFPSFFCFQTFLLQIIIQLAEDGGLDWNALEGALTTQTKCALIQRSCGYSWRRSLSVNEIGRAIKMIKVHILYVL